MPERRLLWIVNHKTLMPAEVPILRDLGWEVFIPKIVPSHDAGYRSSIVTSEFDVDLSIPRTALTILNEHDFYTKPWSMTLDGIINKYFQVVISTVSYYTYPLYEAVNKFDGLTIARVFGREQPLTYTQILSGKHAMIDPRHADLLNDIRQIGARFVFGQAFDNLAEVEADVLKDRASTLTVPLPRWIFNRKRTWSGGGDHALFICPSISDNGYYHAIYKGLKENFGDIPHRIFGRQNSPVEDPHVLPYLADEDLIAMYQNAPVFCYPHTEPRHVHYSPLEAIVIGTPVLYLAGSLMDELAHKAPLAGRCSNVAEMKQKALQLLQGDQALAESIRQVQERILNPFAPELAYQQWSRVLKGTQSEVRPVSKRMVDYTRNGS